MYYILKNSKVSFWVETSNGKVVSACDSLKWSLSKPIGTVIYWCEERRIRVFVAESDAGRKTRLET